MTIPWWEMLLRIGITGLFSIIIGIEREKREKGAGLKTHFIVGISAALIMLVSKYGFTDITNPELYKVDLSRIASNIVVGVGFLGAGVIFTDDKKINGLTTAAGIWGTAAMAMAIGSGMYIPGVTVAVLIVLVQLIFHKRNN